jgi:succinate-semialdehyde dehydrogenase/glutarate-semialdehyde dehydrogenase
MKDSLELKIYPLYLNGEWFTSDVTLPVINPANGEAFARISIVERDRVAQAVTDAQAAFAKWKNLPGVARGQFLERVAAEVERRREEMARLITLENGKPLTQSLGEVTMTTDHLRWFAAEARRAYGRSIPSQVESKRHLVVKTPIGVVGAISPWNFPLALAVRKIAPAWAAGCPVVLKPARQTPLSAVVFAECAATAQLPKGVFQVVVGSAADIGEEFLTNPNCRKITFTGSTEVGKGLIAGAARQVKPLSLELGGQAPVLVFEDADLPRAVEQTLLAKFRNTGQSCIAANRIYLQRSIYDRFLESFTARVKALKVGDGLEPGVEIGPLIDEAAVAKASAHVEDALARGARLVCGGHRVQRTGYFFEPTILVDVPPEALCFCEETFAPVAAICRFESEAEAIGLANASLFGLSAYAFTQDLSRTFRLMESLEAGTISINDGLPTVSHAPFGGVKQSGWGRELGSEGLDAFLETKHISIGLSPS